MWFIKRVRYSLLLLFWSVAFINAWVILSQWDDAGQDDFSWYDVWLVLWASVRSDWSLSPVLQQRVDAALQAYEAWVIHQIIVSWYDQRVWHQEAISMSDYLLWKWVNDADIIVDSGGYDTLASMERTYDEFQKEKVIIFTQRYHLWRALMLADISGLDALWFPVDLHDFRASDVFNVREVFARVKAFIEFVLHPFRS